MRARPSVRFAPRDPHLLQSIHKLKGRSTACQNNST